MVHQNILNILPFACIAAFLGQSSRTKNKNCRSNRPNMQDSHMQANTYAIFSVGKGSNQFIAFLNVVIVLSDFKVHQD